MDKKLTMDDENDEKCLLNVISKQNDIVDRLKDIYIDLRDTYLSQDFKKDFKLILGKYVEFKSSLILDVNVVIGKI